MQIWLVSKHSLTRHGSRHKRYVTVAGPGPWAPAKVPHRNVSNLAAVNFILPWFVKCVHDIFIFVETKYKLTWWIPHAVLTSLLFRTCTSNISKVGILEKLRLRLLCLVLTLQAHWISRNSKGHLRCYISALEAAADSEVKPCHVHSAIMGKSCN